MTQVSVVIPTFRRPDTLPRVLDALEGQTVAPERFEVVVVDDDRDDDPARVAADVAPERRPYPTRVIHRHAPGVSAARNDGWRAADAPLVLFLGDDILPAPDLLGRHLAAHEREPEARVGVLGHVRWADELRVTPFMRWLDRGVQFGYDEIVGDDAGWGRFYTSNASVKREALAAVGGFDESFPFGYEDLDVAKRMHERVGFVLRYDPWARAEHLHRPTLDAWRARMEHVARAERAFCAKHPEVAPYFRDLLAPAAAGPAPRGMGRRLAPLVAPRVPWLGPKVWASVDHHYRRALAPAFLRAWDHEDAASASSGGS